jgi:hypothetical protein
MSESEGASLHPADSYEAIADGFDRSYTRINAATLRLLAGDLYRARGLAEYALRSLTRRPARRFKTVPMGLLRRR